MWSNQAAVAAERDEAITKDLLRHRDPARAGGEEVSGRGEEEAAGPPWQRHERRRCRAAQPELGVWHVLAAELGDAQGRHPREGERRHRHQPRRRRVQHSRRQKQQQRPHDDLSR